MSQDFTFNNEVAAQYENGIRKSLPTYDQIFTMIQSYFRACVSEEASVLVVGAGGGKEIATWGEENPNWTFTGVDPSEDMLKIAEQRIVALDLKERTQLIYGTVHDITVNKQFDAASCILVLHFVEGNDEKLKLLKEISRNLKVNAPFAVVCMYGDPNDSEFLCRMNFWKSIWIDAGITPNEADDMINHIKGLSLIPEKQIRDLLLEAGFEEITSFFQTIHFGGWICRKSNNSAV